MGKNLSSSQIAWLNTLYIFAACMTIIGFFGSWGTQIYYIEKIRELNPESPQANSNTIKNTITAVAVFGVFSTLKFMWDIRHSKNG